ncbi:MAG TPA: hypothetical protein VFJ57_00145 [Solirubrobacterales bacterium]|nr:hypothetical protein [Solirubrobacterales bacterium]
MVGAAGAKGAAIEAFSAGLVNPAEQRAGGHADLNTTFGFATEDASIPAVGPFDPCYTDSGVCERIVGGAAKDIEIELPPGLVGNPNGLARCAISDLSVPACPTAAQVGIGHVGLLALGSTIFGLAKAAVYNLTPERGALAQFGMNVFGVNVIVTVTLRPSDQSLIATVHDVNTALPPYFSDVTIWSVPGAPEHRLEQACSNNNLAWVDEGHCEALLAPKLYPFLANGSECGQLSTARLRVNTYQHPDVYDEATSTPQSLTGCEEESFKPGISVKPTSANTDSPSGLEVNLTIPQAWSNAIDSAEFESGRRLPLATPPLRGAEVILPAGVAISPSQADGLGVCADAQIGIGTDSPIACPDSSKIGDVELSTPLLSEKVGGALYLGTPLSSDPASGDMYRLFMALENEERGLLVKLAGKAKVDPNTGQITTVFDQSPQLPFSELKLSLKSGPRAPLATPTACGTYTTKASLTSWATGMAPVNLQSSFKITQGPNGTACPANGGGLSPKLNAGTANPLAGSYSPFAMQLTREDGQQALSGLNMTLPPGLIGKPAGIPYCPDASIAAAAAKTGAAEQASPSCPAASLVGTSTVGAGPGSSPFYLSTGRVYLAGPYKGAPLSVAVITPALAGPFDLGTVVVRAALQVDPTTTQITAVSDPLPQIVKGVPLRLRDLRIDLSRPEFTLNPTSCDPMAVNATVFGAGSAAANASSRFQVGSCERLAFKPSLGLSFKGATRRSGHPALHAVLKFPKGSNANIRKAQVLLPPTEGIDNRNINNPCTRVQFNANACPPSSILGTAKAYSPLLDKPLEGPVYFRANGGERELPDLVADLNGQIHVVLVGYIDSVRKKGTETSRIRNTFATVPDAPVSRFVLDLKGGKKKGLLENNTNLCKADNHATVKFDAQNGKVHDFNPAVTNGCGSKQGKGAQTSASR